MKGNLSWVHARIVVAKRGKRCGARTRKGTPCRCARVPGRKRCRLHGGLSTGAKTSQGRERIAEAQRQRWALWRAKRGNATEAGTLPENM